jgi:drug/metabolite transporter (DMT)-like permease
VRIYFLITFMVAVSILADYLLKLASERANSMATAEFATGALLYGLTAVGWVYAMKHATLAVIAVAYSVVTLLFLAALGVLVFRETLSGRDVLGLACAVAALALMHKPA